MDIILQEEINELVRHLDILDSVNILDPASLTDDKIKLKSNLIELIELKKEALLDYKKSVLLKQCEIKILNELDEEDKIIGSTCSIAFAFKSGSCSRRNVIIYDSVCIDDVKYYKSFFTHPVYKCELPCKKFLNNNGDCSYNETCKYFHGMILSIDEIMEAIDLDIEICEGDICLTLIEDEDIWRRCKVLYIDHENTSYVVELITFLDDKSDRVFNVQMGRVVKYPIELHEDENDIAIVTEEETNSVVPEVRDSGSKFGDWEKHTRGIGLKLLMKMGYIMNEGLGKNNQGRVSPIHVNVTCTKRYKTKVDIKPIPVKIVNKNSKECIKLSLARNEDKLRKLQSKIESLEKSKERHSCSILVSSADKKIQSMKNQILELNKADKSLTKKLINQKSDKPKKLKIF